MSVDDVKEERDAKSPLISVVLMAYNREQFLKDAFYSVINQTLDKEKYEIVVVKNFDFPPIDYLQEERVKPIWSDEEFMGRFIHDGLVACRGQIIAFLEDDDIWEQNKLETVLDEFNSCHDLIYYHNSVIPVSETGVKIEEPRTFETRHEFEHGSKILFNSTDENRLNDIGQYFPDFNLSSIALKRSVLEKNMEILKRLETAVDTFLFMASIEYGGSILLSSDSLTRYRRHSANQSGKGMEDVEVYLESLHSFTQRAILSYRKLEELYSDRNNDYLEKLATRRLRFTQVLNSIQSGTISRFMTFKFMFGLLPYVGIFNPSLNRGAIMLSLLYLVNPTRARRVLASNM